MLAVEIANEDGWSGRSGNDVSSSFDDGGLYTFMMFVSFTLVTIHSNSSPTVNWDAMDQTRSDFTEVARP